MASKFFLLFLLIAGVMATEENNAELEEFEREEDDMDFDAEEEEAEDVDEVEEEDVEERDLEDDVHMLDQGGKDEVKAFCADPAHAGDPVCQVKM